jgi:hypothetical protein
LFLFFLSVDLPVSFWLRKQTLKSLLHFINVCKILMQNIEILYCNFVIFCLIYICHISLGLVSLIIFFIAFFAISSSAVLKPAQAGFVLFFSTMVCQPVYFSLCLCTSLFLFLFVYPSGKFFLFEYQSVCFFSYLFVLKSVPFLTIKLAYSRRVSNHSYIAILLFYFREGIFHY